MKKVRTLEEIGERAWLRRVRGWFAGGGDRLAIGIGDDAAVLRGGRNMVVSTDSLQEGVHFRWDWTSARDLGRKALAVNLSDLAAMGARPLAAFLALGVPPDTSLETLRQFFMGLRAEGRLHDCPLAGGDLTRAQFWSIAVTVIGEPVGKKVIRRDAARAGDWVYVTGWPGEPGAGREALEMGMEVPRLVGRHLRPTPRLREAAAIAGLNGFGGMLDVSDGLWDDAGKLAEASGVGIELWREKLPVSDALKRFGSQRGKDPREWVMFGGEDYELLWTMRGELDVKRDWPGGNKLAPVWLVGRVRKGRGVRLLDEKMEEMPVRDKTWQHF